MNAKKDKSDKDNKRTNDKRKDEQNNVGHDDATLVANNVTKSSNDSDTDGSMDPFASKK